MPESLPPYRDLFADPGGRLWALVPAPADSMAELRAIGRDGRLLGSVLVPADLKVFEIGLDYVLGLYQEEDGEQHVALYRLHPGE